MDMCISIVWENSTMLCTEKMPDTGFLCTCLHVFKNKYTKSGASLTCLSHFGTVVTENWGEESCQFPGWVKGKQEDREC